MTPDAVRPMDIDESPLPRELPRDCALRLARSKAEAVPIEAGEIALAADTVVALGRRMLGKPQSVDEATRWLHLLSGRRHRVITGVAVAAPGALRSRSVETIVRFRRLSEADIASYVASGEWRGKAGGYAIQGAAAAFAPWISGSYGAVVGLPLPETLTLLESVGWRQ